MRTVLFLVAAFFLFTCSSEASDPVASARLSMTYSVKELPVWSESGEFDPRILVEFLQSAVADAEATNEGQVRITPRKRTGSLVIVADVEMHEKVWDVLTKLRGSQSDKRPDFQKLLLRQRADAIHLNRMESRMHRMEREDLERRRKLSLRDQPSIIP